MKKILPFLVLSLFITLNAMAQVPTHKSHDVFLTTESMDIDGVGDEDVWEALPGTPVGEHWIWDAGVEDMVWESTAPDAADFSVEMKLTHDAAALYVFVDITDDIIIKHADNLTLDPWNADDVEIYVHYRYGSMDTTVNGAEGMRATSYQLLLNHGNAIGSPVFLNNGWDPGSDDDKAKIEWASVPTSGGYSMEVMIPYTLWVDDDMGIGDGTLVPIDQMDSLAFELSVMDADDAAGGGPLLVYSCGETADGLKVSWKPNYWGKIVLLDEEYSGNGINDSRDLDSGLNCYPNPVSDNMTVKLNSSIKIVTITNIVGQQVKYIGNVDNTLVNISTESLVQGVYFVMVEDNMGKVSTSKFVKR